MTTPLSRDHRKILETTVGEARAEAGAGAGQALEALLARLPATVFQADDSRGWSYQFCRRRRRKKCSGR